MKNVIIEKELKFINGTEDLIVSLVKKYAESNQEDFGFVNEKKIRSFVKRTFQSEREYLFEDPLSYENMYLANEDNKLDK
ncbi:hypothetical protein OAN33_06670 [Flavobacteriales bacterium]|nr:hypothetical protein [Flavobacteriales bacterium]